MQNSGSGVEFKEKYTGSMKLMLYFFKLGGGYMVGHFLVILYSLNIINIHLYIFNINNNDNNSEDKGKTTSKLL